MPGKSLTLLSSKTNLIFAPPYSCLLALLAARLSATSMTLSPVSSLTIPLLLFVNCFVCLSSPSSLHLPPYWPSFPCLIPQTETKPVETPKLNVYLSCAAIYVFAAYPVEAKINDL